MTLITWSSDDEEVHAAEVRLGAGVTLHCAVESLGETGWDWHVWDGAGRARPHYGLADTVEEAKARCERALERLRGQLDPVA